MNKIKHHTVIEFFVIKGLYSRKKGNINELDSTLEESLLSVSTEKKWAAEFKFGQSSVTMNV